jgi:hypothetical protein
MAKRPKIKTPIMTPDEKRYMALEGLVQWTQAVVTQSARVSEARDRDQSSLSLGPRSTLKQRLEALQQRRQAVLAFRSEGHFFAIAAHKLLEHLKWIRTFGLCSSVDFSEVDQFSAEHIGDQRDMGEHVIKYFEGEGWFHERWVVETPEYRTEAASIVGTMLGGQLDWVAFGAAAERLLPQLLAEPIPYPPQKPRPHSPPIDATMA